MAVQVVSFHCVLKNKFGKVLSSTFNQNVLTHGPGNQFALNALSDALQNLRKGERRKVHVAAEDAYGYYDPNLVLIRPLDSIVMSEPVRVGERILYKWNGEDRYFRVTALTDDFVTLDGNHPLAGQDLVFEIEAMDARAATAEEIAEANAQSESIEKEALLH